jgi:hypothetical protein
MFDNDEELPGYSRNRSCPAQASSRHGPMRTEFSYSSSENEGKTRITVFVQSRAPSKHMSPIWFEGDSIIGRVELFQSKSIMVKGISVSVGHNASQGSILHSRNNR